uniref:Zinc finger protein n=1 Tax=Elaeophora elaphi TaxID=1147741 RepID=A0A0R3RTW2_9BILA
MLLLHCILAAILPSCTPQVTTVSNENDQLTQARTIDHMRQKNATTGLNVIESQKSSSSMGKRKMPANEKMFKCGESFARRNDLKKHNFTHANERSYMCDECGKRFNRFSSLKRHKLSHINSGSHECDECGKKFSRFGNLKTHKLLHTNNKSYKCDEYSKGFRRVDQLKKRKQIHVKERSHKCDLCGKEFKQNCSLLKHQKEHEYSTENLSCTPTDDISRTAVVITEIISTAKL